MTQQLNEQNFFDNVGGGSGAPSAKLSHVDDFVHGEVVDQYMIDATDFSTKEVKKDKKTGAVIQQLVIVVQTDLRNWAGVTKIPLVDKDDRSSAQKDPSEDDGRRAIYVEPWTNIHAAIGKAVIEATGEKGPVRNGGTLGVKVVELRDTGKGNPLKVHVAKYVAPAPQAASDGFFNETANDQAPAQQAQQAQPAQQAQQAQSQGGGDPWATPAPSTPAADPWGAPQEQAGKSGPPF